MKAADVRLPQNKFTTGNGRDVIEVLQEKSNHKIKMRALLLARSETDPALKSGTTGFSIRTVLVAVDHCNLIRLFK